MSCVHQGNFRAWSVAANIETLVGTGQDRVPGWWHPGEVEGLGC